MIYTGTPENISDKYDEIWFVVRRLKPFQKTERCVYKHVPDLAPSDKLLNWALAHKRNCTFSKKLFDCEYTPRYIEEIYSNPNALNLINYLKTTDKCILLVCYCAREDICHRSILKKLIEL